MRAKKNFSRLEKINEVKSGIENELSESGVDCEGVDVVKYSV
jgi:hypothetical protein